MRGTPRQRRLKQRLAARILSPRTYFMMAVRAAAKQYLESEMWEGGFSQMLRARPPGYVMGKGYKVPTFLRSDPTGFDCDKDRIPLDDMFVYPIAYTRVISDIRYLLQVGAWKSRELERGNEG